MTLGEREDVTRETALQASMDAVVPATAPGPSVPDPAPLHFGPNSVRSFEDIVNAVVDSGEKIR